MPTVIKECVCESAYQDKKYGKSQRVHNVGKGKDGKSSKKTCTVCGRKHDS